jgi:hypothetical protein
MASDISIIHNGSAFVNNSFPFNKPFFLIRVDRGRPSLLIMEVKTSYTYPQRAQVRLNGMQIGWIEPRPWTNHFVVDYEPVSIVIPGSSFSVGYLGLPFPNILQIVPSGTDYLLVANIWLHHPQT